MSAVPNEKSRATVARHLASDQRSGPLPSPGSRGWLAMITPRLALGIAFVGMTATFAEVREIDAAAGSPADGGSARFSH